MCLSSIVGSQIVVNVFTEYSITLYTLGVARALLMQMGTHLVDSLRRHG